jgi:hypothetical protein
MLDEQLFLRCLLDGPRDSLPVLRTEDKRAQDQLIQRALQQFQSFLRLLGRHITRACPCPGKMSTRNIRVSPNVARNPHSARPRKVDGPLLESFNQGLRPERARAFPRPSRKLIMLLLGGPYFRLCLVHWWRSRGHAHGSAFPARASIQSKDVLAPSAGARAC